MQRRVSFFTIACLLVCLIVPAAHASFADLPDREVFSLAWERVEKALARERPVTWSVEIVPQAVGAGGEVMQALLSSLSLEGLLRCAADGGMLTASLRADGHEIGALGQVNDGARTALYLGEDWISIDHERAPEAASMLQLDSLCLALLHFDYASLKNGSIPFVTPLYEQGIALWGLASPYSQDSDRLSVPSGATGHAVTYEIDTDGLRQILRRWADGLSIDGLTVGLTGTALSFGVSQEALDAFARRVRGWADIVEVAKPIKLSTTFGEADVLRTARGSGTLSEDGRRTGISYQYTCSLSSTRITRKHTIDFRPTMMDGVNLTMTLLTSSNGKTSGANEIHVNAKGTFDGQPYQLRIKSEMVNKYGRTEAGELTETITGTLTASLVYGEETLFDVTIDRTGEAVSSPGLTTAVGLSETLHARLSGAGGLLFEGDILLRLDVPEGSPALPDVFETAIQLENLDFIKLEALRESLKETSLRTKQRLMQALPAGAPDRW